MADELYVNGVNLKTYAKNVSSLTSMLTAPALRGSNPISALRSGSQWSGLKPHESGRYIWGIWVAGCADDGSIPSGNRRVEFYRRVDELTALMQGSVSGQSVLTAPAATDPQAGLLRVRHVLPSGSVRTADLELVSSMDFTTDSYAEPVGFVSFELENMGAYWRDENTSTATVAKDANGDTVASAFSGATAPLDDSVVRIIGPATNPKIYDGNTYGSYFQYLGTLAANQILEVDSRNYTLKSVGSSSFTPDYSLLRSVNNLGRLMRFRPGRDGGYRMLLTTEAAQSATASLTGFKKYMVG